MRTGWNAATAAAGVLVGVGISSPAFSALDRRLCRSGSLGFVGRRRRVCCSSERKRWLEPRPARQYLCIRQRPGISRGSPARTLAAGLPFCGDRIHGPSGAGVWTLDRRGNIFSYGDAAEFREVPEPVPWREGSPFVGIAATPTGRGVWLVDRRGRTYSFGDAAEFVSQHRTRANA